MPRSRARAHQRSRAERPDDRSRPSGHVDTLSREYRARVLLHVTRCPRVTAYAICAQRIAPAVGSLVLLFGTAIACAAVISSKRWLIEIAWCTISPLGGAPTCSTLSASSASSEAHWLDDCALFRTPKARFGGASYLGWPANPVRREPADRRELAAQCERTRFAVPIVPPRRTLEGIRAAPRAARARGS